MRIVVDADLKPADFAIIRDALYAYNNSRVDGTDGNLGILLKNEDGETAGGLVARWYYGWIFIELLFVPEAERGKDYGTALVLEAERFAVSRGCTGAWLDTFGFQARGFYEKLGYAVFGELPDYPIGHKRFFLQKRL